MTITATALASASPATTAAPKSGAISSDFETFLKMLTAQMQNQDPLNPIESQDFAVQLATFSGVEQQVRTNDLLAGLVSQLGQSGLSQMAGWIGMEARAAVPALFDGSPVTVYPQVPEGATSATLVVKDASGAVVQRLPIATDGAAVQWRGTDSYGFPLASGAYSFAVEGSKDGATIETLPALVYSRIVEAKVEDGTNILTFESGASTTAENVTGLRLPATNSGS